MSASASIATSPIRFGTSGWRGLIADDFTFANVRLAVTAIAEHVKTKAANRQFWLDTIHDFIPKSFRRWQWRFCSITGSVILSRLWLP